MTGMLIDKRNVQINAAASDERCAKTWILVYALAFQIGLLMMTYFLSSPRDGQLGVAGNDSFYHLRMASLLPAHGFLQEFPWLRFAWFRESGDAFVSHHHGFHMLLLPFVKASEALTGDALAGGRWAVCTFFAGSLVAFVATLRAGGVSPVWVWVLLFFLLPTQFFMRHAYVRAMGPSLLFMLVIVWLILRRRAVALGVAVALFNHLYLGAVLYSPVIVGAYVIACLIDKADHRTFPTKLVLFAAVGWVVGVVTHPYFGGMLEFLQLQVFGTGLSPDIAVGREWKSYSGVWWFVVELCGPLLVIFSLVMVLRFRLGPRLQTDEFFLLLLNCFFLVLALKARRFIEYWPPFCLLTAAFLARPIFSHWRITMTSRRNGMPGVVTKPAAMLLLAGGVMFAVRFRAELSEPVGLLAAAGLIAFFISLFEARTSALRKRGTFLHGAAATAMIPAIAIAGLEGWQVVRKKSQCRFDLAAVSNMMTFLKADSPAGALIITSDWDDFPLYFYHNSHNHYAVGLDPKFTHERSPVLWDRYVKITRGETPASIRVGDSNGGKLDVTIEDVRTHFDAAYAVTDRAHRRMAARLHRSNGLAELVYPGTDYDEYRDAPYLVFRILPACQQTEPRLASRQDRAG